MATVADTAYAIAIARSRTNDLFVDPYARHFVSEDPDVVAATERYLSLPHFTELIHLRTRYLDDAVRDGVAKGLRQVVLLGAGFDMRAFRLPELEVVTTYEIDAPLQVARKRAILAAAGLTTPARVVDVPFDFDAGGDLEAALVARGFRAGVGAVFVWEGVISYIDRAAIEASLRFMARAGGPGTIVALTSGDGVLTETFVQSTGFASYVEHGLDAVWRRYWTSEPFAYASVSRVGVAAV